jgi:hypothetical protein
MSKARGRPPKLSEARLANLALARKVRLENAARRRSVAHSEDANESASMDQDVEDRDSSEVKEEEQTEEEDNDVQATISALRRDLAAERASILSSAPRRRVRRIDARLYRKGVAAQRQRWARSRPASELSSVRSHRRFKLSSRAATDKRKYTRPVSTRFAGRSATWRRNMRNETLVLGISRWLLRSVVLWL